jgi:hypothetical protein
VIRRTAAIGSTWQLGSGSGRHKRRPFGIQLLTFAERRAFLDFVEREFHAGVDRRGQTTLNIAAAVAALTSTFLMTLSSAPFDIPGPRSFIRRREEGTAVKR